MTQPVQADASTFDDVVLPSATHVPLTRARSNLLLLLVALIWGSAFVAQSIGARSSASHARATWRTSRAWARCCSSARRCSRSACSPPRSRTRAS
jgi:hypothetical protein